MDWKTMQADLQRLGTLIEGWSQADEIPAVERDLALEKLRNLYEAIRFADSASVQSAAEPAAAPEAEAGLPEEEFSESLDLGAVLSLDGFPDLEDTEGPIYAEPADPFGIGGLEPGSAETVPDADAESEKEPVEAPAADEPETTAASEPEAEATAASEPEAEATPTTEPEAVPVAEAETIAATETETAPETASETPAAEPVEAPAAEMPAESEPEAEATAASEPEAGATEASEPESAPEPEPERSLASEPTVTLDSEPESETAAPKPHHVSPTLFGDEDEEAVRHRHKQRVIMSLYGPSPVSERTPVSPRHTARKPASTPHAAEPAPAEQPFEVIDITEAPESFVGTADAPTSVDRADSTEQRPAAAQPAAGFHADAQPAPEFTPEPAAAPLAGPEPMATTPDPDSEASDDEAWLSEETISVEEVDGSAPELRNEALDDESGRAGSPVSEAETAGEAPAEPHAAAAPMKGGNGPIPTQGAVLGEVINHHVQTLADTIAPPRDMASELLRNEPVTDLRQAIGLNDKFLLIRDLFDGDGEAFARAIDTLNGFDNLDDCMIFIAEHYAWNPNSDGAKLMMDLLERKFA